MVARPDCGKRRVPRRVEHKTGSDPRRDDEPERARTMAASVKQPLACGERAGTLLSVRQDGQAHQEQPPPTSHGLLQRHFEPQEQPGIAAGM